MSRPLLVVLRALGLGDLLTAVPALRALADAFGDHRRVLLTPQVLAPLALRTGAVDEVVHCDLVGPITPGAALPPVADGADVAVNLHGRGPESTALLAAGRPGRLIAFAGPDAPDGPAWRHDEHEVARWCRLLEAAGIPGDPTRLDLDVRPADLGAGAPVTVLHPGAASPARCWPVERFAQVARAEVRTGHRVLVTGGPSEVPRCHAVAAEAGLPQDAVLAGRTTVEELAGVVAAADRLVCGDTGVAHLATAVGTPSVVLFGPVPPARWGPPADRPRHRALWAGPRPGGGDPHADRPDPSLLALTVDDVVDALGELPDRAVAVRS